MQGDREEDKFLGEYELDDEENDRHRSFFEVKSLFQIMYYHATHGRQKTQTSVMNAHTVYEKCKSRELISVFNKQFMCSLCGLVINQLSFSDPILQNVLFFRCCQLQFFYLVISIHKFY